MPGREREVVDACFLDVLGALGRHEISTAEQSLLSALLMAGGIHASLEAAAAAQAEVAERMRLREFLRILDQLVQDWSPQHRPDVTEALYLVSCPVETLVEKPAV